MFKIGTRIGITERGDAGLDLSWFDKLFAVNGAILITKNLTDAFIDVVNIAHKQGHKLIVHATCTGWGGSVVEPNVPDYRTQLDQMIKLIEGGFPKSQLVLRIDPIFPTENGLKRVSEVIEYATQLGILPEVRVRISVLDEYKHVKDRFKELGFNPIYDGFCANHDMMKATADMLNSFDLTYEACAEPVLASLSDRITETGCVSAKDLQILNLPMPKSSTTNPQNRNGCKCLSCKMELLNCCHRCEHKCAYCYWKD